MVDPSGAEAPIVAFSIERLDAPAARRALAQVGVNVSIINPRSCPLVGGPFSTERLRASFSDAFDDGRVDDALDRIAAVARGRQ
ncbi:hypothetical protein [Brevundimonas diminuta]|uniref:Uncharacterized protein n=1 Tax=Brevundimonas diminuta TaxID=293 RepID=A0A1Z3LW51_BREDI|nr:hypothetical protein [Brevundimonas diminuta]ASD26227.1 hypothetical protein CD943_04580 [Brevundimonas diminuta]